MLEVIHRCARVACVFVVLSLAACGGGGGGGGGGPDLSAAPGLALSPTSLSFTAVQNGALPSTQNVQVTITNPAALGIIVGFPTGVTPPTWFDQNSSFSCTPSLTFCTLVAAINTTSLAPGTYTTTLRFVIGDTPQHALALRDLLVSYTIQPRTGFGANPTSLSFSQLLGAPGPNSQTLAISDIGGGNYAWNASVIYQSGNGWLTLNGGGSASGASLPTSLTIGITPQVVLGTLSATIRFTGNNNTLDVPVSYTVNEPQVTRSAATLTFNTLRLGSAPATQDVTITTQTSLPVGYTTSVTYGVGASGWLTLPASGTAPGTLTFGVNTTTLAPGSYAANVVINTAGAQALPVTVTYVVTEPTLTRSPATLTFNAPNGGPLPASQDVTLATQQSVSLAYTVSISYGAGVTGWLSVPNGTAPGTATASVNTTSLPPATYAATISFTTATQTVSVGVSYVVAGSALTFSPSSSASFTIDTTSVAAALNQNISVGSTGIGLTWTNASSQTWITVSPTSGSSGSSVTLSLVPTELDTLDPGTHSATITFSYTPPGQAPTTATLSVSLNLQLPKITSVNPYVAASGTNLEVILRGSGFSNPGGTVVNFDSTPGTSPNLVSDTEVRVTHPSLTAGSYRVTIPNLLANPNIVRSTASLVVVDAPVYAAKTLAYPDAGPRRPLNIVYDAERQALLAGVGLPTPGAASGALYRYTFTGLDWSATPAVQTVSNFRDLALSMDGKAVIAVSDKQVKQFDPSTLAAGTTTDVNTLLDIIFLNKIAMANDGKAIINTDINGSGFTSVYAYSVRDGVVSVVTQLLSATSGASADGSRVAMASTFESPPEPIFQYNASAGTTSAASATTIFNFPRPALDRKATRVIIAGGPVYDSNYQQLGSIPTSGVVALSPNGSKAYAYTSGTVLHTYNLNGVLSNPDPSVGQFPEIGSGTTLPSDPGANPVMTVSADGGTVFIAGETGIVVVVPAP